MGFHHIALFSGIRNRFVWENHGPDPHFYLFFSIIISAFLIKLTIPPRSVERFSGGCVLLVLMEHSGSVQMAYQASTPEVCGVCKNVIPQGNYFTRHLAPNPWRRTEIIPYTACKQDAPFQKVEQSTRERSLQEIASRLKFESEETVVKLPVVRAKTPRPFPDADEVDTEATIWVPRVHLHEGRRRMGN